MGDDRELVHLIVAGSLSVRQAEAPADGLFPQGHGSGRSQGNDGIEIRHVPSLLEHIHVNHDFYLVGRIFQRYESLDIFVLFPAGLVGVDFHNLVGVISVEEPLRNDHLLQFTGMFRILGDDQHERFYMVCLCVPCVNIQGNLRVFMEADAVFQFDPVQVVLRIMCRIEVLSGRHRRLLHKSVPDGFGKGVFIDDVPEFNRPAATLHLRRRRKLQSDNRVQLIDDLHSSVRPVMVRLVHQ